MHFLCKSASEYFLRYAEDMSENDAEDMSENDDDDVDVDVDDVHDDYDVHVFCLT